MCLETVHVTGLALLFLGAFPGMDSIKGVMTLSCLGLVPIVLKFFNMNEIPFFGDETRKQSWQGERRGPSIMEAALQLLKCSSHQLQSVH